MLTPAPQVNQLIEQASRFRDGIAEVGEGIVREGRDYASICHRHRWASLLDAYAALSDCPYCESEPAMLRGRKRYDDLLADRTA